MPASCGAGPSPEGGEPESVDQLTDLWQAELHHGARWPRRRSTGQHPETAKEPKMTERPPTTGAREIAQVRPGDDGLDELEPETVEDLDVDEDAEDVEGGTAGCHTVTF